MVNWLAPGQPVGADIAGNGHGDSHSIDGKDPTPDVRGGLRQAVSDFGLGVALTDGVYVPVVTLEISTRGGYVELDGFCSISEIKSGAAVITHRFRLMRDGTELIAFSAYLDWGAAAVGYSFPVTLTGDETPNSGPHTYTLEALYAASLTTGTPTGTGRLKAKEFAL